MRVGMVTACYEPVQNGITRMVSLYKRHLERLGHEVTVFTIGQKAEVRGDGSVIVSPGIQYGKSGYFISLRYTRQAKEKLEEMDIIHCHHPMMGLELARRYSSCPLVFTNHTRYDLYAAALTPLSDSLAERITGLLLPKLLQTCDCIVAPSDQMRDLLESWGTSKPIEVIPNGIELDEFRRPIRGIDRERLGIPKEAIAAIYVGRLSSEKNVDVLLRAYKEAASRISNLYLLVVGDGPSRSLLEKMGEELGVATTVRFHGQAPFKEIPGYLSVADLFVTASISEVHPLSVMEAMAAGLPIAGFRSPSLGSLNIDGNCGRLCHEGDRNLGAVIADIADSHQQRMQMGRVARQLSEDMDIRRTVELSLNLYRRLLERHSNESQRPPKTNEILSSTLH